MKALPSWDEIVAFLAERGYKGYGDQASWKTFDGRDMPQWSELPEATRLNWCAAVRAILTPSAIEEVARL